MEENKIKISFTAFIIIAVAIASLLVGIISYAIHNNSNKNYKYAESDNKGASQSSNILESNKENSNKSKNSKNSLNENLNNNSSTENSNTISSNNEKSNSITQKEAINGKTSSISNPLSVGEWGIASKRDYNSSEKQNVDIPIKITNIIRGKTAGNKLKEYLKDSVYKYEEPDDGLEYCIVEYSVDLSKLTPSKSGSKSISLSSKIGKSTGGYDDTSLGTFKDGNKTYITNNIDITYYVYGQRTTKEDFANGAFAGCMPIGETDYIIAFGEKDGSMAFFKGK